jgi:hypothetical protein
MCSTARADFKSWNGSVLLLARRGDYERCSAPASPAARQFVGVGGGGDNVRFELYRPGTFYFVSGVPGRCEAGQRMALLVAGAQPPPFFFAPTSGVALPPDYDEPAVPPPGTTAPPATVVLRLTPSAWMWVFTVGIFLLLLVGIVICCVNEQTKVTTAFMGALEAKHKALATELGRVVLASFTQRAGELV